MPESDPNEIKDGEATVDDLEAPEALFAKVTTSREPGIKIIGIKNPERGLIIDVGDCNW